MRSTDKLIREKLIIEREIELKNNLAQLQSDIKRLLNNFSDSHRVEINTSIYAIHLWDRCAYEVDVKVENVLGDK